MLKSLSEFFGEKVYTYLDYREKIWDQEPYNEGGPVSSVGTGAMRYYAKGLREPFEKLVNLTILSLFLLLRRL